MTTYIVSFIDVDNAHQHARIDAASEDAARILTRSHYRLGLFGTILSVKEADTRDYYSPGAQEHNRRAGQARFYR